MTINKQGYPTLSILFVFLSILNILSFYFIDNIIIKTIAAFVSVSFFLFILQFFRSPNRQIKKNDKALLSPADGTVVVVERTQENEYFKDKRIQVSIFMSAWNIHINWFPISGIIKYFKYHPGLFLFANNPKSSTDNERTTIVIENSKKKEILFRQIAGVMARRIVAPVKVGQIAEQGKEFGFIKFGSRVDIFLPEDTILKVKIGDKVKGQISEIAEI